MARRTYLINAGGNTHKLELQHSYWTSRKAIILNGKRVENSSNPFKIFDTSKVLIDGENAEIEIATSKYGVAYAYRCVYRNQVIQSEEDKQAGKKLTAYEMQKVSTDQYWQELSRMTGLRLLPRVNVTGLGKYRCAGYIGGRFVVAQLVFVSKSEYAYRFELQVIVRCAAISNETELSELVKAALEAEGMQDDECKPCVYARGIVVSLVYDSGKRPAHEMVQKIQKIVEAAIRYTSPPPDRVCESQFCSHPKDQDTQVVFFNSDVLFLCEKCIANAPSIGSKMKRAIDETPAKAPRALFFASGAAIVAAVVWAVVAVALYVFSDTIYLFGLSIVLSSLIPLAAYQTYNKKIQKTTLLGGVLTLILGMLGVVVGVYLFSLLAHLYYADFQWQAVNLISVWSEFRDTPFGKDLLFRSLTVSGLYCLLGIWNTISSIRSTSQSLNSPDIEVVPNSVWHVGA